MPDALDGDVIALEGHQLRVITVAQADSAPSTFVHVPALDAVVAGDVAYNGIHQFLVFTDPGTRLQWIASVEQIEQLHPRIVVAGHKDPGARDDHPAAILGGTKAYLRDFDHALSQSDSPQELAGKMMDLHGNLGNPWSLWISAQAAFDQGQAPST